MNIHHQVIIDNSHKGTIHRGIKYQPIQIHSAETIILHIRLFAVAGVTLISSVPRRRTSSVPTYYGERVRTERQMEKLSPLFEATLLIFFLSYILAKVSTKPWDIQQMCRIAIFCLQSNAACIRMRRMWYNVCQNTCQVAKMTPNPIFQHVLIGLNSFQFECRSVLLLIIRPSCSSKSAEASKPTQDSRLVLQLTPRV